MSFWLKVKLWWRSVVERFKAQQGTQEAAGGATGGGSELPDSGTVSPVVSDPAAFGEIRASFLLDNLRLTTLDLLSHAKTDAEWQRTVAKCHQNGDTHVLVYVFNVQDGPRYGWKTPTTFYRDGYAGTVDMAAVGDMRVLLLRLRTAGLEPILVLHSDDGGYQIGTAERCARHCRLAGELLGDLCCGAQFGIEANEYLRSPWPRGVQRLSGRGLRDLRGSKGEAIEKAGMQAWRDATGKPIAGHYTPGNYSRAVRVGADALFAQFGWLDNDSQMRSKLAAARKAVGTMPLYAGEYDQSSTRRLGLRALNAGLCSGYLNG